MRAELLRGFAGGFVKTEDQRAWFFVLPVLLLVAFNALVPIMTVVNYSVQETFGKIFNAGTEFARDGSQFDALFKVVLIGESNTGKTSMLLRFADNVFNDNYLCTIGVDCQIKTLSVDGKVMKMQIWDTAGQERFRSISMAYY